MISLTSYGTPNLAKTLAQTPVRTFISGLLIEEEDREMDSGISMKNKKPSSAGE
jgi:hypothetical protein